MDREYHRNYYVNRSPEAKARKVRLQRERRWSIRERLYEYKSSRGCSRCPENHPFCLEFHHENDDKEINVSDALQRSWAFERILTEIEKCILLCANCHRKLHWKETLKKETEGGINKIHGV